MAPKTILQRVGLALLALVVVQLVVWRFNDSNQTPATPTSVLLKAPSFVNIAKAQDVVIASAIGDEAGISAWYQASSPITLASIRSKYRTIERETADYILGSVPLPNYDETEDVHLYIHKDGWLLAYYLAAEPSGKIFDWQAYEDSAGATISTKLENTISAILASVGIPFTGATHYDFRYPNATHMMLIAENNVNRDENFTINLPNSIVYSEISWFAADYSDVYLNGAKLGGAGYDVNKQGTILLTQLPPNTFHIIRVYYGYGGLVLIYREQ